MEDYENSEKKEGAVNENIELTEDPIINQGIYTCMKCLFPMLLQKEGYS